MRPVQTAVKFHQDSADSRVRHIFSLFNEYQSGGGGKHTLRALLESAWQCYFSEGKLLFGYRAVQSQAEANNAKRKRLDSDWAGADFARQAVELHTDARERRDMRGNVLAARPMARGCAMRPRAGLELESMKCAPLALTWPNSSFASAARRPAEPETRRQSQKRKSGSL